MAVLNEVISLLLKYWPIILPASIVAYSLSNKYQKGLSKYPGPWLASYTNLWRFIENYGRKTQHTHINLHRKYGDIVRLGPNSLSFADPRAIKTIYGLNKGFVKSDFYPIQQAVSKGRRLESMFSTTNEHYHAQYRRCVNSAFAMSSLVSYEPLVSSTVDIFLSQTEKLFSSTGAKCNFALWLQFFAFDVIGDLTWSKRLGFVERNEDVDGIINFIASFLTYAAPIGQMPFLDLLLEKNPVGLFFQRHGLFAKKIFPVTKFALDQNASRATEMSKIKAHGLPKDDPNHVRAVDLLSKFTNAQHDHPDFMSDERVLTSCVSMIFAGSETTAISLSSVFYFLLKNPRCYKKLMQELDEAVRNGTIEDRPNGQITWAESQRLPYLDAVVQESFRLHPAAGLTLERVVPKQGMEICGEFIPGGTIVGCNAWVLHRRKEVFGEDANVYRPERWLGVRKERATEMKACMFQFGAGARTCLGKNISLLEVYKLVPSFLRRFEIELEHPDCEWKTHNAWFVRQLDFEVRFKSRKIHATV